MKQGIEQAWTLLAACDPQDVCERAEAEYSPEEGSFTLRVLGFPVVVDVAARAIKLSEQDAEFVLTKLAYFSRLSVLYYLLSSQKLEPTGQLVKPSELKAGQIYLKGSHLLPLDQIAVRFSCDPEGFQAQAARFGGQPRPYGDRAAELRPFPRVPITLILWVEDDEFPARSYLLFDETCECQLPPDILWSVAMLCALVMLMN
ncbi:MAG: hypothetical protein A2133_00350 [Actinobacteria bacterium RBG_16_64_13]|nr:MAG: hypothetical protein A2133_00350 [Actinobacteria bacterium RBG_16_64_13]